MESTEYILLDTCVLLNNPEMILRVSEKGGSIYITNIVLDELDYNKDKKNNDEDVKRNARKVFRELSKQATKIKNDANSVKELDDDNIASFMYKNVQVNIIHRDLYRSKGNPDSKIIEIAKDYNMILISSDRGMVIRAQSAGVNSHYWAGIDVKNFSKNDKRSKQSQKITKKREKIKPFRKCNKPILQEEKKIELTTGIPGEGDSVSTSSGQVILLKKSIGKGGEGEIFQTDDSKIVCKIYKPEKLTDLKCSKIKLMLTRKISQKGIAWPIDEVINKSGEFVGYIMPKAQGVPLQPTIFVKPHFEKVLPQWKRRDLAMVCLKFLEHMILLHDANIIVGDINPLNVLCNANSSDVWLVDTDSFQIENYPCPVGTVNFTPPEVQGKKYSNYLRTKEHELFAVSTMLFMILLPGKPPYSQQGGGTPGENIKKNLFPYPFHNQGENVQHHGINLPSGPYRYMWSHLSFDLKEAFHETFRNNNRVSLKKWHKLIKNYLYSIEKSFLSDELFPKQHKITDGITVSCAKCGVDFTAQKQRVESLKARGKNPLCSDCLNEINLRKLAQKGSEQYSSTNQKSNSHFWTKFNKKNSSGNKTTSQARRSTSNTYNKQTNTTIPSKNVKNKKSTTNSLSSVLGCFFAIIILGLAFRFGGWIGVVIAIVAMSLMSNS